MPILLTNEILAAVTHELRNANESVQIISAYCKEKSIEKLDECINKDVSEKRIMIRFRLDDLIKGSTDFSILEYCMSNMWKVYIRFDLHAKTYIVDNKRGFIGSAYATNNGLNINGHGNMEMGTLVDIDKTDLDKINRLFRDAILVDNSMFEKLKEQYNRIDKNSCQSSPSWDKSVINMFTPKVETLFSHELPESSFENRNEYIEFLDMNSSKEIEQIKDAFRWSTVYMWLLGTLEKNGGCLYFGGLTEKLHNALINDPKPYRRDVKVLLSNLLTYVEGLGMEEVMIDKPNYSQRVQLVKA